MSRKRHNLDCNGTQFRAPPLPSVVHKLLNIYRALLKYSNRKYACTQITPTEWSFTIKGLLY